MLALALTLVPLAACERDQPTRADRSFAKADERVDRAREAAERARRYLDLWLDRIDPATGLFPREDPARPPRWRPADNAADNYPFMVLATALFDHEALDGTIDQVLADETARTTRFNGLVDEYSIARQSFVFPEIDLDRLLFNSAEYAKDGLLPVTDLLDDSPWSDRLVELTDSIWRTANVETRFGLVPTHSVEVHGELLQVNCRLYWRTGDPRYLELATRIGDHYLLDQHPTRVRDHLQLRDHGNEIVGGLSELYFTVSFVDPVRQEQYRRPFHDLLDDIAEHGRNDDGLLYDWMGTPAGDPGEHAVQLSDNWGYVLNAFHTAYLVDGTRRHEDVVLEALEGVQRLEDYDWEPPRPHDGLADTIESAIMLQSFLDVSGVELWVDDQMDRMWEIEDEQLLSSIDYLHGNVVRTSLMYLFLLTQGTRLDPWPAGVDLAAVTSGESLFVTVEAERAWEGTLVLDGPRHSTIWGLPRNYPRLNAFPEWFVVDPDATYRLTSAASGTVGRRTGGELLTGVPIAIEGGRLHLEITPDGSVDG